MTRGRAAMLCALVLGVVTPAQALRAQAASPAPAADTAPQAAPAMTPADAGYADASLVPRTIDTLLIIRDGASVRASESGRALLAIFAAQGALDPTEAAWARLAEQLGYEPIQAFDRLLGKRLVYAARTDETGTRAWVVRSQVSRHTELRLRERLKPVPRAIKGGVPVLSVEGGAYEMALLPQEDGASLLLAPAGARTLFDELVSAKGGSPAESFGDSGVLKEMSSLGSAGDVVLFRRLPPEVKGWAAVSATIEGAEVRAGVLVRARAFARAGQVEPWSAAWFDQAKAGAYAAVLDRRAGPGARVAPLNLLAEATGLFDEAIPGQELLGERSMLLVTPSDTGPCSIVLGVETMDIRAAAPAIDAEVARAVARLAPAGFDGSAHDWKGEFPEAMRTADLTRTIGGLAPVLWKRGPVLAWGFVGAGEPAGESQPGWIVVGFEEHATRDAAATLSESAVDGGEAQPWVGLGVVRPGMLMDDLAAKGVAVPLGIESLRSISRAEWRLWMAREGVVVGTAHLEFRP